MRSFRVLALTLVVALFVPSVFAKVCYPKKPVTCNAASFSRLVTSGAVSSAATKAKTTSVKSPAKVQRAMLCGPWVHWMCTAQPGLV